MLKKKLGERGVIRYSIFVPLYLLLSVSLLWISLCSSCSSPVWACLICPLFLFLFNHAIVLCIVSSHVPARHGKKSGHADIFCGNIEEIFWLWKIMRLYFQKKTYSLWKCLMKHLIFGIFIAYIWWFRNIFFAEIFIVDKTRPRKDLIFFHVWLWQA